MSLPVRALLTIALLLAAGGSAAAPGDPPMQIVDGPVRSVAALQGMSLMGVSLRMPLATAERRLAEQGYRRAHASGPLGGRFGDDVDLSVSYQRGEDRLGAIQLSYVRLPRQGLVVSSIWFDDRRDLKARSVQAWRDEIIGRYGEPTQWRKWQTDGVIRDEMAYAASPHLQDFTNRAILESCGYIWQCQDAEQLKTCRAALAAGREPVIAINFVLGGIFYRWEDHDLAYLALSRSRAFRAGDNRGAVCMVPMIH